MDEAQPHDAMLFIAVWLEGGPERALRVKITTVGDYADEVFYATTVPEAATQVERWLRRQEMSQR
ncbi:hypothetical protein NYA9BBAC_01223 [Salinibacterium sp. NYA9b]|uniref:hypothetical protein n=1 Tax=Salinibacterium sp. NK8237 TaxID=2792038 RepID=UPI0018CC83A9|nr:hypothetical protein [Salinibacterium sp. NK8237]MBH0128771.1 hypothetical protein [Salinibacterium sp. NK8237]